jgi:hypothetical protein
VSGLHDHSHSGRSDGLPHGLRNLSGQPLLDLEVNDLTLSYSSTINAIYIIKGVLHS